MLSCMPSTREREVCSILTELENFHKLTFALLLGSSLMRHSNKTWNCVYAIVHRQSRSLSERERKMISFRAWKLHVDRFTVALLSVFQSLDSSRKSSISSAPSNNWPLSSYVSWMLEREVKNLKENHTKLSFGSFFFLRREWNYKFARGNQAKQ